jgi:AraC-like DNA-binding protein
MSNSNLSEDINLRRKSLAELLKEDGKTRPSKWIKDRIEEERKERYERVLKQYDRIIFSITESDILKKYVKKILSAPPALPLTTTTIDECVEQIHKALNNEWRDEFILRYFEKKYWKEEIDSNLRIQRGGANAVTGGIMEDAVLQAFYYFLVGSINEASHGLLQEISVNSVSAPSLAFEWGIRSAILQTLSKIYENALSPIIKRDSCYYAGKAAKQTLIESNLHETLDINIIPLWKIDPKYRGWNGDRLYTLFEKIKEINIEHNAGRPSEGVMERREFAVRVLLSTEELFKRVCQLIYENAEGKPRKKEGLYGACFYVATLDRVIEAANLQSQKGTMRFLLTPFAMGNIPSGRKDECHEVATRFVQTYLQMTIFPVKSLKHWADYFGVSERTLKQRLIDLNKYIPSLEDRIKLVDNLRNFRDK